MRTYSHFLTLIAGLCTLTPQCTHAQDSFFDDFADGSIDDGSPALWIPFDDNGNVAPTPGALRLTPTTGECCFGAYVDLPHTDVVIDMTAQFHSGDDTTFLLANFRDFLNSEVHAGQYWAALGQGGELGIGITSESGVSLTTRRGIFLPTGALGPNDIVRTRTVVAGSNITHTAWLDGNDPSTGATVSWTDRRNTYPSGDIFAVSLNPNDNLSADVSVLSVGVTLVPEPTSGLLLVLSLSLAGSSRRLRAK